MILLSALLASLSGLVAGERPVQRAPVELSAIAAAARSAAEAAVAVSERPANVVAPSVARLTQAPRMAPSAVALRLRTFLAIKQSWLN